jgi:HEAT repeat protein/cyclophilin family peptidyl-prolyl cis-trans isomerase
MLSDDEARVRRRAALAIGRVGLAEGVQPLVRLLTDADPEVRQMAAFSLGLIGDGSAVEPLVRALADPAPVVKGSAAEALGLIGDARAVEPVARMAADIVVSGGLAVIPTDELDSARDTPAAALRLALNALVRLKSYDGLATAVLDSAGLPRVRWWPVAFALQRLEDSRALQALLALLADPHPYTRALAAKGLGAMRDRAAAESALLPLVSAPERAIAIEAIRSLGRLRATGAGPALVKLIQTPKADPHLRLEAVTAIGATGGQGVADLLIDLLGDPDPKLRSAAIRSFAQLDAEGFITVLSGLDADVDWRVRSTLAGVLGTLTTETGMPRLRGMLGDPDARVIPAVLAAIASLKPSDAGAILIEHLKAEDPVIRSAAARAIATVKPDGAETALIEAYARGQGDATYLARASALTALAAYGAGPATPTLVTALADKDWAVRVHAAGILKQLDRTSNVEHAIRPAPTADDPAAYAQPGLVAPPFSSEAYIETDRGTIRIELAMLDAPLTVRNFTTLARRGFFDGTQIHRVVPDFVVQMGDPRGDGEGGPGYSIRDELNQRPYLRGTVGMALDWKDTGGSQFFITHSPQPHLDAKYTVFGRVLSGMDVVDQIEQWDVVRRIRIWDGSSEN